ncbi:MAG: DnaJ domain-containing protein [Myxococcota bacterium]
MATIAPAEIRALSKIIEELDYYQILHIERDASPTTLKKAYYATSRAYHPDANRHLDPDLRAGCDRITKRLTEAYCVVRDPRRRRAYDQKLAGGHGLRMQLAEAKAAHAKQESEERQGKTAQGRQFFQKAMQALERDDRTGAIQNLQMAQTFEPDNAYFKEKLEEVRKKPS